MNNKVFVPIHHRNNNCMGCYSLEKRRIGTLYNSHFLPQHSLLLMIIC